MKEKSAAKLWTIGHSTRTLAEFLELLAINDIEAIADVRSYPGSRRHPHFNDAALAESLPAKKVDYVPFKKLGGRRKPRPDSPNTIWRSKSFQGYADYMETTKFTDGLAALLDLARSSRTAVMCAEAVWWRCHRALISDYLKASGVTVEHIMDGKTNVVHPFTSAARIIDGKLTYGPCDAAL